VTDSTASHGNPYRISPSGRGVLGSKWALAALSVLLALAIVTFVLWSLGYDVGTAYASLLRGSFGSSPAIGDVLARMTPLVFVGLAVALPYRAGLFNVGGEGQLIVGALAAAIVGQVEGLPTLVHVPLVLACAAVVGALCGWVPAALKHWFGAHEVITTLMLNSLIALGASYLVNGPLHPDGEISPATAPIAGGATLSRLITGSQVSLGIGLAVLCAVVLHVLLFHTSSGYEIRAVGLNPSAAEAVGIRTGRVWMTSMSIGGGAAGLGGAIEVLAVHRRFVDGFSEGYGYSGIAVALIAFGAPLGVLASAALFGMIRAGSLELDRVTDIPPDVILVLQGVTLLVLGLPPILVRWLGRVRVHEHARPPSNELVEGGRQYVRASSGGVDDRT
jgi:simple sugar transport system permease protein